jgi:hypothetical protein
VAPAVKDAQEAPVARVVREAEARDRADPVDLLGRSDQADQEAWVRVAGGRPLVRVVADRPLVRVAGASLNDGLIVKLGRRGRVRSLRFTVQVVGYRIVHVAANLLDQVVLARRVHTVGEQHDIEILRGVDP